MDGNHLIPQVKNLKIRMISTKKYGVGFCSASTTILLFSLPSILNDTSSLLLSITEREPYHTSILTDEGWVMELLAGYPKRIRCELGVHHHVFLELLQELRQLGHSQWDLCISLHH